MGAFFFTVSVLSPDNTKLRNMVEKVKTTVGNVFATRDRRQWDIPFERGSKKDAEKHLVDSTN